VTSPGHDQRTKIIHQVMFYREQTDEVEAEMNVETQNKKEEEKFNISKYSK